VTTAIANLRALRNLLFECTALITGADGGRGTGFFVDDGLLLTCAHVVAGPKGTAVKVKPEGRAERPGKVVQYLKGVLVDLAVVEAEGVEGEAIQPAVVLDRLLSDQVMYFAVGYPKGVIDPNPGSEELEYKGHRRRGEVETSLLIFDDNQPAVTKGLSGGAVLNPETGAVVGLIQYTNRETDPSGGGAIPIERAYSKLDTIKALVDRPPLAASRWKELLGEAAWTALGKPPSGVVPLDLTIKRDGATWTVCLDDGGETAMSAQNLVPDVATALFKWAQWRRIRGTKDVDLLGRLLGSAVFPPPVAKRIAARSLSDELLVRLRFTDDQKRDDEEEYLANVPWEFATIERAGRVARLAADRGVALVRLANHQQPDQVTIGAPETKARVLGIVIAPDELVGQMPTALYNGRPVPWPARTEITGALEQAVKANRGMTFAPLENPGPTALKERLEQLGAGGGIDVVHYIGFCRHSGDMALAAPGPGGVVWRSAEEVLGWIFSSGARLVVIEFAVPPLGDDLEPLSPSRLLTLRGRTNAVVFTRYPVHPWQFAMFNTRFYLALESKPVELAVRDARLQLAGDQPLNDAASFGWFTLITGPAPGMQVVATSVASGDPRGTGMRQPEAPRPADAPAPVTTPSAGTTDAFEGFG
jgi:hypothetical protein